MKNYQCQICGKPATINYIETINGVTRETHYCSECASKSNMNMFSFTPDSMTSLVSSIFGQAYPKREERVCDACGTRASDVLENYKFGCDKCYEVFSDIADKFVVSLGGGVHKGKRPEVTNSSEIKAQSGKKAEKEDKLTSLKKELIKAVKEERYIDADRIKKQIDAYGEDK